MGNKYVRGINAEFIKDLKTGSLSWFLEEVKLNDKLCLEIRKDYINIYYMGGNALRIIQKKNGYRFEFDEKYCLDEKTRTKVKAFRTIDDYRDNFSLLLSEMDAWFDEFPKEERRIQHELIKQNTSGFCIIDIEYAGSYISEDGKKKNFRLDMLAVHNNNLVIVENKVGEKSMGGSAGIVKHYNDISAIIESEEAKKNLLESARSIASNKRELGLPTADITIDMIEILFVLIDFNKKSKMLTNQLAKINPAYNLKIVFMSEAGPIDYANAEELSSYGGYSIAQLEDIVNRTFSGLQMFVRDVNLPEQ